MTADEARDRFKAVVSEHVTDFQAAYLINMAALDYVEASCKWLLAQFGQIVASTTKPSLSTPTPKESPL